MSFDFFRNHLAVRSPRHGGPRPHDRARLFGSVTYYTGQGMSEEDAVIRTIQEAPELKRALSGHWLEVVEEAGV